MKKTKSKRADVAVVMGSRNDWKKLQGCEEIFREFGISYHVEVVSAHRTPQRMHEFAGECHNFFRVVIAGAGGSAHLPGMIAAMTHLPVIGVPISSASLDGIDSLLSIVQMPKGIPVATVAIDNGTNAALLAARILGVHDSKIAAALKRYHETQKRKVLKNSDPRKVERMKKG